MLNKILVINLLCMVIIISFGITLSNIFITTSLNNQYDDPSINAPLENFKNIYKNNIHLLFNVFLGTITCGVYSFLLLCWNSFHLGTGIISLLQMNKSNYFILFSYMTLEFTSLCLSVTAAENLGINLFWYILKYRKPKGILKTIILTLISLLMITLAGILETLYIYVS